jgi:hypothetical protein
MSLPEVFERTREPLGLPVAQEEVTEALPGVGLTLNFQIEQQAQTLWCWLAVAVSVAHFYNQGIFLSQCGLANDLLHTNICCSNGAACNQMGRLDLALAQNHNLLPPIKAAAATFGEVSQMINNNRPLGCGIRWSNGLAHFVTIYGFSRDFNGAEWVAVADPMYGYFDLPYQTFGLNYRGSGRWVFSYATKP